MASMKIVLVGYAEGRASVLAYGTLKCCLSRLEVTPKDGYSRVCMVPPRLGGKDVSLHRAAANRIKSSHPAIALVASPLGA